MQAIILAAGYATRLGERAQGRAKALMPIGEKPIINFIVDDLARIEGLSTVHVISNHKFIGQFEEWRARAVLKPEYAHIDIRVWDDGTVSNEDRLGAIGDMQFTIDRAGIDDDLFVAAGDNFFTFHLGELVDAFKRSGQDVICATHFEDRELLHRFAVAEVDADGTVLSMEEKPACPRSDLGVYALYVYRRDTVPLIRRYLELGYPNDAPGHFPSWLCSRDNPLRRPVHAYLFKGECVDIGTPESYDDAVRRFGVKGF
ncbi:MAG: NDP-sugar synthase [Candidatus Fimadaptatus sp.]